MTAVDQTLSSFDNAGWAIATREQVTAGRGPNPTRVDLARGKQRLSLLIYAWRITGEGKGRTGTDFRIQTTRSHKADLIIEVGRLTLGFGIDNDRDVLAVFDGWTKRATGSSSSVHIDRATLDKAAADGFAEQSPAWDSRAAARIGDVSTLLPWIRALDKRRTAAVQPLSHAVDGENATVTADLWNAAPAAYLRVSDQLVIASRDGQHLLDNGLWRINDLHVSVQTQPGKNPRRSIVFSCHRHGYINDEAAVLEGLTRRPNP